MIFFKLSQDAFGDEPERSFGIFVDQLIATHTDNVNDGFTQVNVMLRQGVEDFKLNDEITRYADSNIVLYALEEKIDPDYFYIALQYRAMPGHAQMLSIIRDIEAHPSFVECDKTLRFIGVISDVSQCVPCTKKKMEQANSMMTRFPKTERNEIADIDIDLQPRKGGSI